MLRRLLPKSQFLHAPHSQGPQRNTLLVEVGSAGGHSQEHGRKQEMVEGVQ